MLIRSLTQQFLRDLQASWQKTAILAGLLLVGLFLWIPPLVQALSGSSSPKPEVAQTSNTPSPSPVQAETDFSSRAKNPRNQAKSWKSAEVLLTSDPLVQSVEVAAIHSNPFQVNQDQFSPPILFEKDPPLEDADRAVSDSQSESGLPEDLVLKSTIVGVNRRAALLNGKLYYEGRKIQIDGRTFLLAAVYPRKVKLVQGSQEYELTIQDHLSESIDFRKSKSGK